MKFVISTASPYSIECDCLIEFVNKNGLTALSDDQPQAQQEAIATLRATGDLTDNTNAHLILPQGKNKAKRVLLVPIDFDDSKKNSALAQSKHVTALAKTIVTALKNISAAHICLQFDHRYGLSSTLSADDLVDSRVFMVALMNALYSSDEFKGKETQKTNAKKIKQQPKPTKITIMTQADTKAIKTGVVQGIAVGEGMALARSLGDAPPNICNPLYLTKTAKNLAKTFSKIKTTVLGEKELQKLGAGAFLAVTQGSAQPPQLILMDYKGNDAKTAPIVLVGKGLTFDSGGISLKPGASMDEMKYDMGGAASVFGAMQAIAALELPINVVGAIAAAENMPSDRATRPGDIVTTMSGQTVEILNTDAEGRLVLCDTLTYIQRYNPKAVIDIATLTGACIVALGFNTAALMSNTLGLAETLQKLSMDIDDPCWQLPLWPEFAEDLKSNFADIPNIGNGRGAGTLVAGAYLQKFVAKNTPWAHLDIAGVAWTTGKNKGATGRPVHLLVSYLLQEAESIRANPRKKTTLTKTSKGSKAPKPDNPAKHHG